MKNIHTRPTIHSTCHHKGNANEFFSLYKYSSSSSFVNFPLLELIASNFPTIPSQKQLTQAFPLPKFKSSTMASSKTRNNKAGKQQQDFLSPVTQIAKPSLVRNQEYIPEPHLLEEKRKIFQSQVLIPLTIVYTP